jgi:hypothetical protein
MLVAEIALRGAIAYGPFIFKETEGGAFVAGEAINEAYEYEQLQDWVGMMLAPSVIQEVQTLAELCTLHDRANLIDRMEWAAFVQRYVEIPFHAASYDGFAIVPSDGDTDFSALCRSLTIASKQLARLKSIAPDPRAQAKYERSMRWISALQGQWGFIADRDANRD